MKASFRRRIGVAAVALVALAAGTVIVTQQNRSTQPDSGSGSLTPTTEALAAGSKYVALGDSYASGFGLEPYTDDSNTESNNCRRSQLSYPQILAADRQFELTTVACQGAQTLHLYEDRQIWAQPPQLESLGLDTDLVTLTIGANDVDWAATLQDCVLISLGGTPCNTDSTITGPVVSMIEKLSGQEEDSGIRSFEEVFASIAEKAPKARVVIVGYPPLFAGQGGKGSRCNGLLHEDQLWTSDLIAELNQEAEQSALAAGFNFIDPSDAFIGHELCSQEPWLMDLTEAGPFHPAAEGQQRLASLINEALPT